MEISTARRILEHIKTYFKSVKTIQPYNWGEPLLCKNLAEYMKVFAEYPQFSLEFSSNMNAEIPPDLPRSILPGISKFMFSVSGFNQETYEKYHRGGNIKRVFDNIGLFLQAREETGANTIFQLIYGRNRYNARDEYDMEEFCLKNGIQFTPFRYILADVSEVHKVYLGEQVPEESWEVFYNSYEELRSEILDNLQPSNCLRIRNEISLDVRGYVTTCCLTHVSIGVPMWDIKDADALETARLNKPFCQKCFEIGLSGYSFAQTDVYAQLYCDTGKGFNEWQSSLESYSSGDSKIKACYKIPGNTLGLRFDPANYPIKAKITANVKYKGGNNKQGIDILGTNGALDAEGYTVFNHSDPAYLLNCAGVDFAAADCVYFEGEIIKLND